MAGDKGRGAARVGGGNRGPLRAIEAAAAAAPTPPRLTSNSRREIAIQLAKNCRLTMLAMPLAARRFPAHNICHGAGVGVGAYTPVPVIEITCGLFAAVSVRVRVSERGPGCWGAKLTLTTHEALGCSTLGHGLEK